MNVNKVFKNLNNIENKIFRLFSGNSVVNGISFEYFL